MGIVLLYSVYKDTWTASLCVRPISVLFSCEAFL